MTYRLTIPGPPVGKARPRVTRYGTYTPKATKEYEALVRGLWLEEYGQTGLDGALRVEITAYFVPPKSASKRRRQDMLDGQERPIKKPDADNIAKAVLDALNGVAYKDDCQSVDIAIHKYYGEPARVELIISEDNDG